MSPAETAPVLHFVVLPTLSAPAPVDAQWLAAVDFLQTVAAVLWMWHWYPGD